MTPGENLRIRELRSLEDCRGVVAIQEEVWGRDGETVPASVLLVSAKRGGILLGVDAGAPVVNGPARAGNLAAFVWSMPGVRDDGRRTHWSHMLAVLPAYRQHRLGERLKWSQREQALRQGAELIEWTFDPLQAANAHFNLRVLGGIGATYGVDVYGALAGPLHRGTPTDRLIVEWRISEPYVAARQAARQGGPATTVQARSSELLDAAAAIQTVDREGWTRVKSVDTAFSGLRLLVPIPPRFLEMQQNETALALEWRLAIRDVMTNALANGYHAVDFYLDRERGGGNYLLAREP
jgi:predicted GNAT superfamily acetyltransferase